VGIGAVSIYTLIGLILGMIAGLSGGVADGAIMRFTDTVLSFPPLIIILTLVSLIGPNLSTVILVIGLLGWPSVCRIVRGVTLSVRQHEYITAARAVGVDRRRLLAGHILPNVVAPVTIAATFGVAHAILLEAGLSFLGLGVRPPTPSWGNMLNEARTLTILESMPWLWIPPGLMIALAVLSINFIGDGLRDALDPRTKEN
jgi:peptide/nickel transport system permease protein